MWFHSSGQLWKVYTFFLFVGLAIVMSAFGFISDLAGDHDAVRALAAIGSTAIALLWLGLAIRCPACNGRPGWWVLTNVSAAHWFTTFLQLQKCPLCGDRATPSGEAARR
jgi:uncharacterized membrane protein YhaH (DUF805 family)